MLRQLLLEHVPFLIICCKSQVKSQTQLICYSKTLNLPSCTETNQISCGFHFPTSTSTHTHAHAHAHAHTTNAMSIQFLREVLILSMGTAFIRCYEQYLSDAKTLDYSYCDPMLFDFILCCRNNLSYLFGSYRYLLCNSARS